MDNQVQCKTDERKPDVLKLEVVNSETSTRDALPSKDRSASAYKKCSFYIPYASISDVSQANARPPSYLDLSNTPEMVDEITRVAESNLELEPKQEHHFKEHSVRSHGLQRSYSSDMIYEKHVKDQDEECQDGHHFHHKISTRVPTKLRRPSKTGPNVNNLDHILSVIGSFGLYQKLQFLLVGFLAILPSMVAYSYVFVSATPKFTCSMAIVTETKHVVTDLTGYEDTSSSSAEFHSEELANSWMRQSSLENYDFKSIEHKRFLRLIPKGIKNKSLITFDGKCKLDLNIHQMHGHSANKSITKVKCIEWLYDDSVYGKTLVTEWNLVCLKSHLKAMTQNAYILGTGCSVFTGIIADNIGRRSALMLMITLMVLFLNTTQILMHLPSLTVNQKIIMFTISRFFQGVAQTMYSISFVLLLEITGPSHRLTAGNILAYAFSIGQMVLVGLAYLFKDCHKLQWSLAIYVLPFFLYYFLVPESPRWLISSNKVRDARRVIQKITRVNKRFTKLIDAVKIEYATRIRGLNPSEAKKEALKKHIDLENDQASSLYVYLLLEEDAKKLNEKRKPTYTETFLGICKSPALLKRFFTLFYIWMVILCIYLGISMSIAGNLDKVYNPYVVFFVAGVFEFLSIVTCHLILNKLGRKYPLICFMFMSAVCIYLIPFYYKRKSNLLTLVFYLLAKFSISAAQLTCMIYTGELYPTPMRSTGVGLSVAIARLGGVWAPQISILGATLNSYQLPFIVFSVLSLLAGVLGGLYLPETYNKPLPENLDEAEHLNKAKKKRRRF